MAKTLLQHLRDANPGPNVWLRDKFQTSLRLVNGHHIVVRFDLASCGTEGYMFDAGKVALLYGDLILGDNQDLLEDSLAISIRYEHTCGAIADTLNEKMQLVANGVLGHIRTSFDILDALSLPDYRTAGQLVNQLAIALDDYNPQGKKVWSPWIVKVCGIIASGTLPGFGVDSLM